jgi:hypothetical protein
VVFQDRWMPTSLRLQPNDSPRCVVCQKDIRSGAAICTECKSPQNWTRHVLAWKDVVSVVLALVPLWGGAWALWNLAFTKSVAQVRTVAVLCEEARLVLAFANDGEVAAIMQIPRLKEVREGQITLLQIQLRPEGDDKYPFVLAAKQSLTATLQPVVQGVNASLPTVSRTSAAKCSLLIETNFRGFGSHEGSASARCGCPVKA